MMKGVAASPGIVIGQAHVLKEYPIHIDQQPIAAEQVEAELQKFEEALVKAKSQLEIIRDKAKKEMGADKAEIFGAHLMMLEDEVFLGEIREKIKSESLRAEYALTLVVAAYTEMFQNMEDEYLKERAADIQDVSDRLVKNLLNIPMQSLADLAEEVVIIARDLTPSDTAQMNKECVMAFATEMGGRTSHTAIMARSLEIPAVVGCVGLLAEVQNGDLVIVDGNKGLVFLNPDQDTLEQYRKAQEEYARYIQELKELKDLPAETNDQARRVELVANIGTPKDCAGALANGAEGIGLYRTEFLYMDRAALPGEDEQFVAYKAVAEEMKGRPVIIRTLDIGGDKKLPYLDMPEEMNPFLGWRAIRMCLDREEILRTQLRAIMRASAYGTLRIMYPMVSNADEIRKANAILAEVKADLDREGIPYDRNLQVGIMVEIPAAAVIADLLIKEVDFFSIGTNDLIQYTIAVDRMNEHISYLYEPLHPAVLRLVKNVIDASHRAGKWTGMCGEMAGDVAAAPILLGLGLDEFSMSAVSIPRVKKVIRGLTWAEAQEIAQKALAAESAEEIRRLLKTEEESLAN
ncbi:MAG TPA: phosphoenolpyruvate--protein phosphotransferase [Peptococcaceae bacterium]|jgi:phosphotransferase system enzyme I (PtsI)|nr:phosphoenolpyruvate--protein phosphotransferase [Clostridia bacterium]HOB81391.1 phosphoenolpyruvate--protein phosphotransferase [Peptococcaceae bacterium]HPZ71532.1 phosphoenolpyruvate--protein phosphotransferase [Peptococcaceae bacterium]HQD53442.1 phosphoenolpyruvate--protein phosphotransferase [Peptococcaceae bacterium]